MIGSAAVEFLREIPLGTRVVVRYRLDQGATDALGYLRSRTAENCSVETKRGLSSIDLVDVIAAKPVPEPPARRYTRPATSGK